MTRRTTTTTATLIAVATLAAPALRAETVDILQDLSLEATVTAFARANSGTRVPDLEIIFEEVFVDDADSATATSFDGFPIAASAEAFAEFQPEGSVFSAGGFGTAEGEIRGSRGVGAVSFSGDLGATDDFEQFDASGGSGSAAFDVVFGFRLTEDATATVDAENLLMINSNSITNPLPVTITALGSDDPLLAIDGRDGPDSRVERKVRLNAGDYVLAFSGELAAQNDDRELGGFSTGLRVERLDPATPIPSPAALPAGLAVLGGLLTCRRR